MMEWCWIYPLGFGLPAGWMGFGHGPRDGVGLAPNEPLLGVGLVFVSFVLLDFDTVHFFILGIRVG